MRYGTILLSLGAALSLPVAMPAVAQDTITVTDVVIPDNPELFLDTEVLADALFDTQDDETLRDSEGLRASLKGAIRSEAFKRNADDIIRSFNLNLVAGLQFATLGNKAAVEQDGLRNLARIDQSAGNAGWAVINQTGEDNATLIDQADTRAAGQASLNRVYVGQVGNAVSSNAAFYSNYARVEQIHKTTFTLNNTVNTATIQQGGFRELAAAPYNAVGAGNDALIHQEGAGNDGVIQQGAESPNVFFAEQGDTVGRNNRAILRQEGYGNRAAILQEDDANAITHQFGFDNEAYVRQDGDVLDGGQYSLIEQGGTLDVHGNFATVFQRGQLQESTILQKSNRNDAHVYQTAESAYAKSTIEQSGGIGNFASVLQTASAVTVADGVFSSILQQGSLNQAYVSQGTISSVSTIAQTGNGHFARVRQ